MCGRNPDKHHAVAAALPPPSVVEMAHGRRLGEEYNEEEDDDRDFEEEFLRFSMMEDDDDDEEEFLRFSMMEDDDEDEDEDEEIIAVSPPRRPPVGATGTSAVESVTNLQARTRIPNPVADQTGGDGTKAKRRGRVGGGTKRAPAAARSKHGFLGVHRRTYGRWAAEIRDTVIKGSRVWIGTYDTAEAAARAYDAAARRIYGHNARTNFPADDDGERPPQPAPALPPAAKPCSSSKQPKKRNSSGTSRRRRRDAAATPQQAVSAGSSDLSGETPAPAAAVEFISLNTAAVQALELTDGWEFEPFIQELLLGGGVAPVDYINAQDQHAAAAGDLWSF